MEKFQGSLPEHDSGSLGSLLMQGQGAHWAGAAVKFCKPGGHRGLKWGDTQTGLAR